MKNIYKVNEEAVKKIAERVYDNGSTVINRNDLEEMFPELKKESEDERIRKAIKLMYSFLPNKPKYIGDVSVEDMFAWLEKQGTSYTKRDIDDAYLKGISDAKNEIEKQYEASYQIRKDIATFIFNYKGDIKDRAKWMDYLGIKVSFTEKQGEQPTDKVEPKFKVGDIVKHKDNPYLTYILKRFTADGDYEFHAIGKDGNEGCTCFSVVKYQDEWELVEQKTAEVRTTGYWHVEDVEQKPWSEEDEMHLHSIESTIEFCKRGNANVSLIVQNYNADLDWLKSLKDRVLPQPKQEWSEEDEELLHDVSDTYFYNDEDYPEETYKQMLKRVLDWMNKRAKSLRPQKQDVMSEDEFRHIVGYLVQDIVANEHMPEGEKQPTRVFVEKYYNKLRPQKQWKPSDEQLDSLYDVLNPCDGFNREVLESLYVQLKKLREE